MKTLSNKPLLVFSIIMFFFVTVISLQAYNGMNKVDVAEVENSEETMTPQVNISGPTTVEHGESENWTAHITGGCSSAYDWYYKQYPQLYWIMIQSGSNDTYNHVFYNYDWDPFSDYLLKVEIKCGGVVYSDEYYITVNPI